MPSLQHHDVGSEVVEQLKLWVQITRDPKWAENIPKESVHQTRDYKNAENQN